MSNKDRIRRIRDILLNDWDPLVINGYGPADEYDRYISGIVQLLDDCCTAEQLEQHLARIEKEQMLVPFKSSEKSHRVLEHWMMSHADRAQRIRTILVKDWDPLGVGDNPHLTDEYDAYIPDILRLIDNHCPADQLERYLLDIEEKWELTPDAAASQAARKILKTLQDRN